MVKIIIAYYFDKKKKNNQPIHLKVLVSNVTHITKKYLIKSEYKNDYTNENYDHIKKFFRSPILQSQCGVVDGCINLGKITVSVRER